MALLSSKYLNADEEKEHQFIPFKESPARVDEDSKRDAVEQIPHAALQVLRGLSASQRVLEHDAVRLQRELVHHVDSV